MGSEILNVVIENLTSIAATLLMTLIGVMGAWLTAKIGKRTEFSNISHAIAEVSEATRLTVRELGQLYVANWKEISKDGKLSDDEIAFLGEELLKLTKKKLAAPSIKLLNAASVDINEIIKAAGEAAVKWEPHNIKAKDYIGPYDVETAPTCNP